MRHRYSEAAIAEMVTTLLDLALDESCNLYEQCCHRLSDTLPRDVADRMDNVARADLDELGRLIQISMSLDEALWTSSTLMAFRVFEDAIRELAWTIEGEENQGVPLKLLLDRLSCHFSTSFSEMLGRLRSLRNEGMHSVRRFSEKTAMPIIEVCLKLALHAYSISGD